jgi:hypothetical protein
MAVAWLMLWALAAVWCGVTLPLTNASDVLGGGSCSQLSGTGSAALLAVCG